MNSQEDLGSFFGVVFYAQPSEIMLIVIIAKIMQHSIFSLQIAVNRYNCKNYAKFYHFSAK